jgi:hypothetical protein
MTLFNAEQWYRFNEHCGCTLGRVLGYIAEYNRYRGPGWHDPTSLHVLRRYHGLRSRDFTWWPNNDIFGALWREGTPYGCVVYDEEQDKAWFEPAQGFDLGSQDWPPE